VWVTAKGRRLTAAGSAYWENHFRQGRTDGRGHVAVQSTAQRKAAAEQLPTYPYTKRGPRAEATLPGQPARGPKLSASEQAAIALESQLSRGALASRRRAQQAGIAVMPSSIPIRAASYLGGSLYAAPVGGAHLAADFGKDIYGFERQAFAGKHPRDPFPRTRRNVAAMARQVGHDFAHPSESGYAAPVVDALGLAAPVVGVASRGAAAGSALRAGEGAAAAARAFRRPPRAAPRVITAEGVTVEKNASRAAVSAVGQRLTDKALAALAGRNPRGVAASIRTGQVRRQVTAEARYLGAARQAPGTALERAGKRLSPVQETVLRVVEERTPIDARIAAHERELPRLGSAERARVRRKITLLQKARRFVDESSGVPEIRPEFARLADVSARVQRAGAATDQAAVASGRMTAEAAAGRKNAPARIVEGAAYVKPTPGKLGIPSQALLKARSRADRLQAAYGRALARSSARSAETRPATRWEAESRLAELEAEHERLLKDATARLKGGVPFDAAETARRNVERFRARGTARGHAVEGRTVAGGRGPLTQAQELRDMAQTQLDQLAERNAGEPWAKAYLAQRDEITRLRGVLNETHPLLGETPGAPADFGLAAKRPGRSVYDATVTRLGAAASVAKDEVAALESAAAKRVKPTGIVGGEDAAPGRTYIPYTDRPARRSLRGVQISWRGGIPKPRRTTGSYTAPFTGEAFRTGRFRDETSQLVARRFKEEVQIGQSEWIRDRLLPAAKADPEATGAGENAIAVRLSGGRMPAAARDYLDRVAAGEPGNPVELERMADAVRRSVFIGTKKEIQAGRLSQAQLDEFHRLNADGKIGWLDPKLIPRTAPAFRYAGDSKTLYAAAYMFRELNAAMKTGIITARPAYLLPNMGGNGLLLVTQQGPVRAVANFKRALAAGSHLEPEQLAKLDALAQTRQGITGSITDAARGPATTAAHAVAGAWEPLLDMPFRRASLLYEIQRETGMASFDWAKVRDFLDHADDAATVRVAQEGNAAAIDYGRMGPNEKAIMRQILFIYPWFKGSFVYAGRVFRDHPAAAALFTQMGQFGQERGRQAYGVPVPSILEGTTVMGGGIVNPLNLGVLGTPYEAKRVMDWFRGRPTETGRPTDFLTPPLQAVSDVVAASAGHERFPGPAGFVEKSILEPQPYYQLDKRLTGEPSPTAIYQPRNVWEKISPVVVGGLYPRGFSRRNVEKRARDEQLAGMPADRRARARVFDERKAWAEEVNRLDLRVGGLGAGVKQAFNRKAERAAAWAKASKGKYPGTVEYQRARLEADVRLAVRWGKLDPAEAKRTLEKAKTAPLDKIKKAREWFTENAYEDAFLAKLRDGRKAIRDAGGVVPDG
jgi:hypothetical protein